MFRSAVAGTMNIMPGKVQMPSLPITYYVNRPSSRTSTPPPKALISGYNAQKTSSMLTSDLSLPATAAAAAVAMDCAEPTFLPATSSSIKTPKPENASHSALAQ